jgi:hypothetical protein
MRLRPAALLLAAAAQGIEAVMLLVAAVLTAADTAAGRSYQRSSGIALTIIAFGAVIVVALIAVGIFSARRWSRTPALLTQLFVGTTGVYLLDGHRLDLGLLTLLVALAGFAGLLVPPSWRALAIDPARPPGPADPSAPEASATPARPAATMRPATPAGPPAARAARPSGKKAPSRRR